MSKEDDEISISLSSNYWTIILAAVENIIERNWPILERMNKERVDPKRISPAMRTSLVGPLIIRSKLVSDLSDAGVLTPEAKDQLGEEAFRELIERLAETGYEP